MKSSSIKLVQEAGIPEPNKYRDALIHNWYLDDDYRKALEQYFLRETTPEELFFHIDRDGELLIQGRSYSITWINGAKAIRESLQCLVSIRYCKYLNRGYALIKTKDGDFTNERLEY